MSDKKRQKKKKGRRTQVNNLARTAKRLTAKEQKTVKGGLAMAEISVSVNGTGEVVATSENVGALSSIHPHLWSIDPQH